MTHNEITNTRKQIGIAGTLIGDETTEIRIMFHNGSSAIALVGAANELPEFIEALNAWGARKAAECLRAETESL